jgi:hypothetical protein
VTTDEGAGWGALVLTIVAQILFGVAFGFVGVLLALPMTIDFVTLVKTLWVEDVLAIRPGKRRTSDARLGTIFLPWPLDR